MFNTAVSQESVWTNTIIVSGLKDPYLYRMRICFWNIMPCRAIWGHRINVKVTWWSTVMSSGRAWSNNMSTKSGHFTLYRSEIAGNVNLLDSAAFMEYYICACRSCPVPFWYFGDLHDWQGLHWPFPNPWAFRIHVWWADKGPDEVWTPERWTGLKSESR